MIMVIRSLLVTFTIGLVCAFRKDYSKSKKNHTLGNESILKSSIIGLVTDFLDTLGIGSFAITIVLMKVFKLNVPSKLIPGTLNVGHAIPIITEALIFTTVISVDSLTLASLVIASVLGSCIGVKCIVKLDENKIKLVMGIALLITAVLMFLGQPGVDLIPIGGEATGLTGVKLVIGIVGNFILGVLMTAGIGLYAPCMAMVYLLGMSAKVAFPIMMASCAMLMPIASVKFIQEQAYSKRVSLGIMIAGVFGVLIAAFIVKSLEMTLLRWLVIIVIIYTAITMLIPVIKNIKQNK